MADLFDIIVARKLSGVGMADLFDVVIARKLSGGGGGETAKVGTAKVGNSTIA